MKNRLYILFISLAILGAPEFILAQAARNNNTAKPSTQKTSTSTQKTSTSTQKTNSPAQKTNPNDQKKKNDTPNYTLSQNKSFAHWSYGISIGGNVFDGDIIESDKRIFPTSELDFTLGANIERTFNPIFGFGIEYLYLPYSAEPKNSDYKMTGTMQTGDIYLSINMANLFYRSRPQKWGVFLNVGMGLAHYNARMKNKTTGEILLYENTPINLKNGVALTWPFALTAEYNISKYIAIGLKAEYRMFDKDNLEGYTVNIRKGNWNDAFEVLSLTFRHKLHFGETYHVRNLSYGDPSVRDLSKRLADMENAIKNMSKPDSCCTNNTQKIDQIEKQLEQKADTGFVIKKLAEQGISDINPAPAIVPVSNTNNGETTGKGVIDEKIKRTFNIALRGIQFETAKSDIKPVSFPILGEIVTIMKENPGFDLDIIGYTDNVGEIKSNMDLSERRAHSVRKYLMDKGVDGVRLTSSGKGPNDPIATNNSSEGRALNRRVEFVVKQGNVVIFKTE